MQIFTIHELKTKMSAILRQIEKTGENGLTCRNGKTVAQLEPVGESGCNRPEQHPVMSEIAIHYDPTEPLSDEEWGSIE